MNTSLLPHDNDAELSVLSACLYDHGSINEIVDILSPDDFFSTENQKVFKAMLGARSGNISQPLEMSKFTSLLKAENVSLSIIPELQMIPMAVNIVNVAGVIRQKAILRKAILLANAGIKGMMNCIDEEASGVLDRFQREILAIDISDGSQSDVTSITDIALSSLDRYELAATGKGSVAACSTGFSDLDGLIGGLHRSDLIILAARPGMGKTAFAMNIAEQCEVPALIFSMEMSKDQLFDRMLSRASGIDLHRLTTGKLSSDDWTLLNQCASKLSELPIFINDSPGLHFSEVRKRARNAYKQHGIRLIIIDYLQLMRGDIAKGGNREYEIASISRALKELAKELNIPVLALSQLNRKLEDRSEKRPMLSDIRESGAIEQDADLVIFIYRDEIYNRADDFPNKGVAEIMVAKHRNGPTGYVTLMFDASTTSFENRY